MRRLSPTLLLVPLLLGGCHPESRRDDPADPVLRIYLARHGQTDWNAAKRLQGWSDIALNDTGQAQARDLAKKLDGIPIERIYCSALRRSRETAEIVAAGRVPIETVEALNEQKLGKFEGAYLDGRDPAIAAEYERRSKDPDDALDSGESRHAHHARVRGAVEQIARRHRNGSILIVGHGGTNAAIVAAVLGLDSEQALAVRQANDELYLLELSAKHEPRVYKLIPPDRLSEL